MRFTDIFIRQPVLATVVSLFILLLGLRAIVDLNVRQFPEVKNAVVTVSTAYIGADADLIQGFVTTPIEREVAAAEGIDYLVSTSVPGISVIQAYLRLDDDPNQALTQIAAQVNKVRGDLPTEAEDPVVELTVGESIAAMYLSFFSDRLANNQITDYLTRVVEPELSTIAGVQRAEILGGETFAMRIWLDADRMAAYGVTGRDIRAALQANNVLAAVGRTRGQLVTVDLTAETDLSRPDEFERLIVREEEGAMVRLEDIATVELGSESYDVSVRFNAQNATFVGIELSPDANALDVIADVRDAFRERIRPQLPEGLNAEIVYDSTDYIESAIEEVIVTIALALSIVLVVIYLFLGSLRSVAIPAVSIPLSLIGTFLLMLLMGFSINLLTLLAMVLAIGIVVDDAIIMVENVHRHIEDGMRPFDAALQGARELAWPIVAMSTTLIAVFLPIGFVGGLTGTLFVEFAFTLAGAVLISGIVALTLSPMLASRILKGHEGGRPGGRLEGWLDARFSALQARYRRRLHGALNERFTLLAFGLIVLVSCYFLFVTSSSELEPPEDQGFVFSVMEGDAYLGLDLVERNTRLIDGFLDEIPELRNIFIVNGFGGGATPSTNEAIAGFVMAPWDQRGRSTGEILEQDLQPRLDTIPALSIFAVEPPSLPSPGGGGAPVSMVIGSTGPTENLGEFADEIIDRAMASGRFIFMDSDLDFDKPRVDLKIDRDKAAQMGIDMAMLTADLAPLLSGGFTGRFALDNRSYRVIPLVQRSERLNPDQLGELYTRTRDGEPVPLSNIVTLEETVVPRSLRRFQQLNAVTLSGVPRPGVTLGEALDLLDGIAAEVLPTGYTIDYAGQSRQLKAEGAQFVATFFFALIVIYLVLAAQFESFRDPLIMLMTVPMSVAGALVFISLGFTSLNIYTQVGLVTLIGLIAKHGILIVEFANQLQRKGHSMREAIEEAASLRLRPILMTTAATVIAMVPLLLASGAGAGSRFAMGLVIASGMTIGTLFTLFVVPAVYLYLARDRAVPAVSGVSAPGPA
ncbi:RND multidrug efflux transporter; Acriflavin resistance protein [Thioalkalivibrio nitratireducens DSM 14787]|uniref:RND multidrug efflux transporter Acriflavin resistance protein n=1 Tax=Thioalkalivibrio nitratireducens (strain DSM 14787 / UNIQEM 213 / ALEN2) TaxID=1255043 RepID=L0DTG4_THIND|nr:efflux RND transporter permease subunit [Thioalkalivibrio nitratireducens]AGA32874.1 RND multidrug efflux transporter; Acriflavin resistance protein [Thioalkalivibrio nitratireducens DSM 14787]